MLQLDPDGAEVLSFATCNTLGLDRDPRLADAAIDAIRRSGVSFSASRCFVTSPPYAEAEALLEQVFSRPVVLAGSTTLAHAAALPILVEPGDAVLHDHQVHHSVQAALVGLPARPKVEVLPHNDLNRLEEAVRTALARGARRVWYCADGVYSMFGDRLPVDDLAALMRRYPALWAYLDDAHGMSWAGARGAGTLLDAGLPVDRTVLATSLSKGFGAGGGVIAVPDVTTRHRIENLGPALMFGIQLPPPVLGAIALPGRPGGLTAGGRTDASGVTGAASAGSSDRRGHPARRRRGFRASARIHLTPEITTLQDELASRVVLAQRRIAEDPGTPTPIGYVVLGDTVRTAASARRLVDQGVLVNPVAWPAVPRSAGGLRWTLTRAHTDADIERLVSALGELVRSLPAEQAPQRLAAAS